MDKRTTDKSKGSSGGYAPLLRRERNKPILESINLIKMKHYIINITLIVLAFAGILLGAFGSEIIKSLTGISLPSLFTLILGIMLSWACVVAFINYNTNWIKNY